MASFFAEVVAVVKRTQRWQFLLIDFIELQYLSCLPPHTVRFNMTLPIFLECFMPRFCWFCDNSFPPKLSLQQIGITQVVAVSSTKLYKVAGRLKIMFCQDKYVLMELSFWIFKPRSCTFKYFSWKLQTLSTSCLCWIYLKIEIYNAEFLGERLNFILLIKFIIKSVALKFYSWNQSAYYTVSTLPQPQAGFFHWLRSTVVKNS